MLPPNMAADLARYKIEQHYRTGPDGPWIEHLMDDEGFSHAQAREAMLGWEKIPYIDAEHGHMATLIKKGREVHFAIFKRFRKSGYVTNERIKEFLKPILDDNVFLITKIDRPEDSRFIEWLGFEPLSVAPDGIQCYILNNIKYPRLHNVSSIQA